MELSFSNILYDNSAKKAEDAVESSEKTSYPGMDDLYKKIKERFPKAEIGSLICVNGKNYKVRYRGSKSDGWSWGGIADDGPYLVFAIKEIMNNDKREFHMFIIDSAFVIKKNPNRGSWGTSEEERKKINDYVASDASELNRTIVEYISNPNVK